MPESFFIVSKEFLDLAIDEVIAIAKSYDRFAKSQVSTNVVIIQSKTPWYRIAKRAAFVKISGQVLRRMSALFLEEQNALILKNTKTFACRVINVSKKNIDVEELERSMGNMISKFTQAVVSLNSPELIVYLIFSEGLSFFGFSDTKENSIRPKKVEKFHHELDWKISRAMINLACLKEGETICDPFCGTGTTLLEAESMGIHSIGIDFDPKMYDMCKKNINANNFNSKIILGDYTELIKLIDQFDGIVTDLPYGRASKTSIDPRKLLKEFVSIIPNGKKFAIMFKKDLENDLDIKNSKKYSIYRHKSLTRTILVK